MITVTSRATFFMGECTYFFAGGNHLSEKRKHSPGRSRSSFKVEMPRPERQNCFVKTVFTGPVYVVRDNIDTDQIIPAQYLNLVPTIPEEYEKLGSFAMVGLPDSLYPVRYIKPGQLDSEYTIVVAGRNFGCGSSREHAPIALGSAGAKV